MTNFKCQMTNEYQISNFKFCHWDFPTRSVSGRVDIDLTFEIVHLTLSRLNIDGDTEGCTK